MDRRVVATLTVAVALVLAGCSALPVFDDGAAGPAATPTATDTPTPAATPTTEPVDYPGGYGPTGLDDPDLAAASHQRTLANYDSYRFRFDVGTGTGNGTRDAFVYLVRVEQASETALEIRDAGGDRTRYQYFENDRIYLKLETGDGEVYNASEFAFEPVQFTGIGFLLPLFDNVTYGRPTIVETPNGTLYRYESETVTDPRAVLRADVDRGDLESIDVDLVVHEDGYVRAARYVAVTTDGAELAAIAEVSAVNRTDVERPDWYDRAADG